MAVFLTGDIHGEIDIRKLGAKHFASEGLTRDDYVIVLGDFGLLWSDPPTAEEAFWLDWLEDKPWTTLFVDGNHENHVLLGSLPTSMWHGGQVHVVRNHVLHLMRGEVFTIEGNSFFCMGGAYSIDKEWRTPGISWWEEEVPNNAERTHALNTLDAAGWNVDYVLTHCPPLGALCQILDSKDHALVMADEYTEWLDCIAAKLEFKRWYFGHIHMDIPDGQPYAALYNDIVRLLPGGDFHKVELRKPLHMPAPRCPLGYSIQEIADYWECSLAQADQAVEKALRGQTMGLHPRTGEVLVYSSDIRKVLRCLERELG